jgi:chromosome segregation ATPase
MLSLSENARSQLQLLIPLLELDTAILVQDAGSIREIFNLIKDELPSQLKETLKPAAFIEYHEPKFSGAQSRLAAREAQKNLPIQEKQCISSMLELKQSIDQLNGSPARINQKLTALREEKEQLLSRLKTVEASIKDEEDNLAKVPIALKEQKQAMACLKSELQSIKTERRAPVPGTVEEDRQQIADIDSIRLKALDSI